MRIGVALGGGGARGWAHIGVLRTLMREGFEPDVVTGTSIGAIVGGAYAAGRLDQLEEFARRIDRAAIWRLTDINLSKGGLVLGERVAHALAEVIGDPEISTLPKKFVAVATELQTGHEAWIEKGSLIAAMGASYALPGILAPALIDGRHLIDGGVTNPVPVSTCRAAGARLVIAVPMPSGQMAPVTPARSATLVGAGAWNRTLTAFREPERFVASKLFGDEPDAVTFASVSVTALNILLDRNARVRLASDPPDVSISAEVGKIALLEFDRADEAIRIGAEAAEKALPQIEAIVRERSALTAEPKRAN